MDVIGSLCVLLGSSTVQLHDSLGSRRACACSEAGFSSQNGDHVSEVCYRRAAFCCALFLWAKELNAKDIHKEMFPVSLMTRRLKPRCESSRDNSQKLLCCGFRRKEKAMGEVQYILFQFRIQRVLHFTPISGLFTDYPS
jgi:hypothetical protein